MWRRKNSEREKTESSINKFSYRAPTNPLLELEWKKGSCALKSRWKLFGSVFNQREGPSSDSLLFWSPLQMLSWGAAWGVGRNTPSPDQSCLHCGFNGRRFTSVEMWRRELFSVRQSSVDAPCRQQQRSKTSRSLLWACLGRSKPDKITTVCLSL